MKTSTQFNPTHFFRSLYPSLCRVVSTHHNGLIGQSLNGTGTNRVTVYYVEHFTLWELKRDMYFGIVSVPFPHKFCWIKATYLFNLPINGQTSYVSLLLLFSQSVQGAEGLPLNVQISTPPYDDETCLRIMKDLENELKNQS